MNKTEFEIGDRVVCIKEFNELGYKVAKNTYGTLVEFYYEDDKPRYGIIWDNYNDGHNFIKGSRNNNSLYVDYKNIKKLKKPVHRKRNVLMKHVQALFIKIKDHYKCCHSRMDGIVRRFDSFAKQIEDNKEFNERQIKINERRYKDIRNLEAITTIINKTIGSHSRSINNIEEKNKIQLRVNEMFTKEIDAIKKDLHEINPFVDTAKERYEQLKKDNDGDNENLYQKCERVMKNEPVNEQGYTMEEIKKHYKDGGHVMFCNMVYGRNNAPLDFTANIWNYKIVVFPTKGGQNGC